MKFILTIKTDNEVVGERENPFGDSTHFEVSRILHKLAERIEDSGIAVLSRDQDDPFVLMDANNQTVGTAHFEEED